MTRQDLLDFSADQIGQTWTVASHQTLVVALRELERARDVISLRNTDCLKRALDEVEDRQRRAASTAEEYNRLLDRKVQRMCGASYHHSLIDPEAAEI